MNMSWLRYNTTLFKISFPYKGKFGYLIYFQSYKVNWHAKIVNSFEHTSDKKKIYVTWISDLILILYSVYCIVLRNIYIYTLCMTRGILSITCQKLFLKNLTFLHKIFQIPILRHQPFKSL